MLELGVKIVAGTDAGTRTAMLDRLPSEMSLYVEQLGLSPVAAIRAGSGAAAEQLGIAADVGTVQAGRWADLAVIDGDPSTEIRALERSRAVVKAGQVVAEYGRLLI
jgi:imidazolonepropionase-like amidohydrolase